MCQVFVCSRWLLTERFPLHVLSNFKLAKLLVPGLGNWTNLTAVHLMLR